MKQTEALIIGASFSGLSVAAALYKQGIEYLVIEKQSKVASSWHTHYERLHLHTNKRVSNLPYKKFGSTIPRYPTRQQVIDYLEDYRREFNINPIFNTQATSIQKDDSNWITETNNGTFSSKYVIMATGALSRPKKIHFKGMETFPGRILHSCDYKTGKDFANQEVLVIGFGNSACEIAIDLYEQGSIPSMSVRSPVNIIPRDVAGIPILELSQFMSRLPPRMADTINAPLMRLIFGDIRKLGLRKMTYGPFEQIKKDRTIPVLDIGIVKHIRKGHVKIYQGVDHIEGSTVYFSDGKKAQFEVIVAAIGFDRNNAEIVEIDRKRFEDLNVCITKQKYFGKDGLYFSGFWIAPTGHIHEISGDAIKIAKDIARQKSLNKDSRQKAV